MSYALLFSGQGEQHGDMFPWLEGAPAAQEALAALAGVVGPGWRGRLEEETARAANVFAQPVIVGTQVAAWGMLQPLLATPPQVVAGYSVGEVAAFCAAGAYDARRAVLLSERRAVLMDDAVAGEDTGLIAISRVTEADVAMACPELECAIRIDVDNNVYGGQSRALAHAQHLLRDRARFKLLRVSLASHTHWMQPALAAFEQFVRTAPFATPVCPVALDATGVTSRDATVLASALVAQIGQCVEWRACMAAVAERQPSCVLEIGGGQALARMWAARYPQIPARSLDEFHTPEGAAGWISRHE